MVFVVFRGGALVPRLTLGSPTSTKFHLVEGKGFINAICMIFLPFTYKNLVTFYHQQPTRESYSTEQVAYVYSCMEADAVICSMVSASRTKKNLSFNIEYLQKRIMQKRKKKNFPI